MLFSHSKFGFIAPIYIYMVRAPAQITRVEKFFFIIIVIASRKVQRKIINLSKIKGFTFQRWNEDV